MEWDLTYEIDKKNEKQKNISFPLGSDDEYREMYTKNKTLYLHFLMETPNIYDKTINFTANPQYQMRKNFRQTVPIVHYMK